jgi:hypothetical protein
VRFLSRISKRAKIAPKLCAHDQDGYFCGLVRWHYVVWCVGSLASLQRDLLA